MFTTLRAPLRACCTDDMRRAAMLSTCMAQISLITFHCRQAKGLGGKLQVCGVLELQLAAGLPEVLQSCPEAIVCSLLTIHGLLEAVTRSSSTHLLRILQYLQRKLLLDLSLPAQRIASRYSPWCVRGQGWFKSYIVAVDGLNRYRCKQSSLHSRWVSTG